MGVGTSLTLRPAVPMGHVTGVMFSPEDLDIVRGAPQGRRRFVDMLLSQCGAGYYYALQTYNAALKLCTILLYAEGYRPEKTLAHYRTLQALPLILGTERQDDADYLDTCRSKRNTAGDLASAGEDRTGKFKFCISRESIASKAKI